MSRSSYSDDLDNWDLIRWRGMVASATRGKRGQQFFRDLVAALDAMPEKALIEKELESPDGVCALGSLGRARGITMSSLDPHDSEAVAEAFNIAPCLEREVVYENDEHLTWPRESPQDRWKRMRKWATGQVRA